MLVLSNRVNEKVRLFTTDADGKTQEIGFVQVVEIRGNLVRLGFEFGKDVKIFRQSVLDKAGNNGHPPVDAPTGSAPEQLP